MADEIKPENSGSRRWQNRRRMAWVSLISMLVVTILFMFCVPIEKMKELDAVVTWFYTVMAAIVGAYLGFSTFDQKWRDNTDREFLHRHKNPDEPPQQSEKVND